MLWVMNRIFEAIVLITHNIHFEGEIRQKSGNTTITYCRPTHGTMRKSPRTPTVTRHQEDISSNATSSLFLVTMIAKLERPLSNAKQNKDQIQSPHNLMGGTLNNESSTTEPSPQNGQQLNHAKTS